MHKNDLLPEEKTLQAGEGGGRVEAEVGRESHEETFPILLLLLTDLLFQRNNMLLLTDLLYQDL